MCNTFYKEVENLIKERKEIYKKSHDDMISAYNGEKGISADYDGRQVLELLQNADDAQADYILFRLDTKKNILTIANKGSKCEPFSLEGINSLLLSNLSSKTTDNYIGNKGLGFRSILTWADKIELCTKGVSLIFSRESANQVYDEIIPSEEHKKIQNSRNLSENEKPIAILSSPILSTKEDNTEWTTSIHITYKDKELTNIQGQLDILQKESLLFLNNLETITIKSTDKEDISHTKESIANKWYLHRKKDILPNELRSNPDKEEKFQLCIAIQDKLTNEGSDKLFSYFPTKITIDFPFLIHGTFELTSSRNDLVSNDKNKYLLKELVKLIIKVAKDISKQKISYKALELLSYTNQNPTLQELGFYTEIDTAIETLKVFPCIDEIYRNKANTIESNKLATLLQETNQVVLCPNLIVAERPSTLSLSQYNIKSTVNKSIITDLSKSTITNTQRAELIYLLVKKEIEFTTNEEQKFDLLLDRKDNLISTEETAYTPNSSTMQFPIPSFTKIKFIQQELFEELVKRFGLETSKEQARELQRQLKEVTSIQSYEPAPVISKIIFSAKEEIKKESGNTESSIQEMIQSLYSYYTNYKSTQSKNPPKIEYPMIPLLSQEGITPNARNLYLSSTYPSGKLTTYLFDEIFSKNEFIADITSYPIKDNSTYDSQIMEDFFLWLGVNKYTKFSKIENSTIEYDYQQFVFKSVRKPEKYRCSQITFKKIEKFEEIVDKLSKEKLVLWFMTDSTIQTQLQDNCNKDTFYYDRKKEHYTNNYYRSIKNIPSYIKYQIISSEIFEDYYINGNEELCKIINDKTFNFQDECFNKFDSKFNRKDIIECLLNIGATKEFTNLSSKAIDRIIQELPEKSPQGDLSQRIYKLCIDNFSEKGIIIPDNTKLFAIKGDEKGYFPREEVYYSGQIQLPKKITNKLAILNYPKRQNEQAICKFFGIQDFSKIEIKDIVKQENKERTEEFSNLLNSIKQYILAYKIQGIESDETAKSDAVKLQKLNIILCDKISYQDNNGDKFCLDDNDYLKNDYDYLIKINTNEQCTEIINTLPFQESFADIIGLLFDIQNTDKYRDMIYNRADRTKQIIISDLGQDVLDRAYKLYYNQSEEYFSFWQTIYNLLGKSWKYKSEDKNIDKKIKVDLGIEKIPEFNYSQLIYTKIKELFENLNLSDKLAEFNEQAEYKIDFYIYHKSKLKDAFNDYETTFTNRLYTTCIDQGEEKLFNDKINEYRNNSSFIEEQIKNDKEKYQVCYSNIVKEYVKESFPNLSTESTTINFQEIYAQHTSKINDLNGNQNYLSLLYFKEIKEVEEYIDKQKEEEQEQENQKQIQNNSTSNTVSACKIQLANISPSKSKVTANLSRNTQHGYKYNQNHEQTKQARGQTAEQIAYTSLVYKYGQDNVIYTAQNDDSAGYDIKYKEDNQWKYVEVKTYSNNKFFLSANEKKFAYDNIDKYELFLVNILYKSIYLIKDIKSCLNKATPSEYIVGYNLDNITDIDC